MEVSWRVGQPSRVGTWLRRSRLPCLCCAHARCVFRNLLLLFVLRIVLCAGRRDGPSDGLHSAEGHHEPLPIGAHAREVAEVQGSLHRVLRRCALTRIHRDGAGTFILPILVSVTAACAKWIAASEERSGMGQGDLAEVTRARQCQSFECMRTC